MATCPRCGEPMTGGICDNCGFPLTKMRKKPTADNKKPDMAKNGNIMCKLLSISVLHEI